MKNARRVLKVHARSFGAVYWSHILSGEDDGPAWCFTRLHHAGLARIYKRVIITSDEI